jgi:hypothetical protein
VLKLFAALLGSRGFFVATLLWFCFQAAWMASSTVSGIAPDEGAHTRTIQLYAASTMSPFLANQPEETFSLGAVTRSPSYLYHYVLSFPYRLFPSALSEEGKKLMLRLITIFFSLGGLIALYRAMLVLSAPRAVAGLVVWMLSNTLMFVFLAGSVSYDNLEFLLSTLAFYYWAKLFTASGAGELNGEDALKLGISMCAASITKFTFLPLGATLLFLLVVRHRRNLSRVVRSCCRAFVSRDFSTLLLGLVFLILFGLFIERYGINYYRYGSYKPQCDQVLTYQQCLQSALFSRNLEFRDKPVSRSIPDLEFTYRWVKKMKYGVFAILGHRWTRCDPIIREGTTILFVAMLVAVLATLRRSDSRQLALLAIVSVYAATLLLHNYSLFVQSGRFGLALQGRYIFPVLGILYFVGISAFFQVVGKREYLFGVCASFVFVLFLLGGLPRYIKITPPEWHTERMVEMNREVRKVLAFLP